MTAQRWPDSLNPGAPVRVYSGCMLEVTGLHKRYGNLVAVEEVSFVARPGEMVGLLGPNGAGKTTTVSMIARLMAPVRGQQPRDHGDGGGFSGAVRPQQPDHFPRPRCEGNLLHGHQVPVTLVQSRHFQHASRVYANYRAGVQTTRPTARPN